MIAKEFSDITQGILQLVTDASAQATISGELTKLVAAFSENETALTENVATVTKQTENIQALKNENYELFRKANTAPSPAQQQQQQQDEKPVDISSLSLKDLGI